MKLTYRLVLFFCFFLAWEGAEAAFQDSPLRILHQEPTMIERHSKVELHFEVPGITANEVKDAYLFYRLEGDIAYRQKKAELLSYRFKVSLTVDNRQATEVEYYFEIQLNNGERVTYPTNLGSRGPVEVDVVAQRKGSREERVAQTGVDYTILSPNPDATVSPNDVTVALTLFYDPAEIDTARTSFEMLVDGEDVTKQANASDYFYSYAPEEISPGEHTVTFNLTKSDTSLMVASWKFRVLNPTASGIARSGVGGMGNEWMPSGQFELSARNQQVGGVANDALSGNVRFSGQKGDVSYSAYGLLTSQESPRLQPQNRYGVNLYVGDWLELEAGHVYPTLSPMTIAGQRMQGLNAGLHILDNTLNLQFVYGKLRRGIANIYQNIEADPRIIQQDTVDTHYLLSMADGGRGVYQREVVGGRIGLGRGDNFEFGLNFLKVQDDTNSIRVIDEYQTLMNVHPGLAENLSQQQRQELSQNPGELNVQGNPRPKGNFVAASDLKFSLDSDRIQFRADGAVSLVNEDISKGVLSQETAEDLGLTLDNQTENLLQQLSWLIIINENMSTLPLRFEETASGTTAEAFFPTGLLATQSQLGLNYFDNNLKLRYRWVGPGYNSLANSTIRKDIAGFSVTDRMQLFQNRIYLTLGYEGLHDNVVNDKEATTNTQTFRTNVSWYPLDQDLPRVSLGFLNRNRDNSVPLFNPYLSDNRERAAVQNFEIQNGDTLVAPNARLTNSYQLNSSISQQFSLFGMSHDASMNYSFITTDDQRFIYGGSQSSSFSMEIVNRFEQKPLQTSIGFSVNNTEMGGGLTDIRIVGARAGASLFLLEDKLNVNTTIAFTSNHSESSSLEINENGTPGHPVDDYYEPVSANSEVSVSESHSYIINAGGRYTFNNRHSVRFSFRYSNVRSTIASRALPNDHLLQARYIFNF